MVVTIPDLAFGFIIPEIIVTVSAVIGLLLAAFGRKESSGAAAGAVALIGQRPGDDLYLLSLGRQRQHFQQPLHHRQFRHVLQRAGRSSFLCW